MATRRRVGLFVIVMVEGGGWGLNVNEVLRGWRLMIDERD